MKKYNLIVSILICLASIAHSQTCSLVQLDTNGKLIYKKYANHGEDTLVNVIPDFSFAGYKRGGVSLPVVIPVKETLEPDGVSDDRQRIQNAINRVSALPLDEHGIRGVILLKKGLYQVNGTLNINAGGVILRGENQAPAENGGTEIVATARSQHSLIKIEGQIISNDNIGLNLGEQIASFNYPELNQWIINDVSESVKSEFNNDSVITFIFYSKISGNYKFWSKENGDDLKNPYLNLIYKKVSSQTNDTINIYPTDDTYVKSGDRNTTTVHGIESRVYYKNTNPESDVTRIGFIKFDLSQLDGTIVSATLHVCSAREDQDGQNFIAVDSNDYWTEESRTWDNTFFDSNADSRILTDYVGTGATGFTVENVSRFKPGDKIFVQRTPNYLWIDTLEMNTLHQKDPESSDWTTSSYTINHPRAITVTNGDTVFIDIPIVDPMQKLYGGGSILLNTEDIPVENSAVENMFLSSEYSSEDDEKHGWDGIKLLKVKNCWVKNVTARYFGYSSVNISTCSFCTVQDCALLDPKSITTGGRKYPFPISGKGIGNLVQRCYARGGRHSFVTHSRLTGPHVFLDCYAAKTYSDIGPHHRWAAGILFDNIYGGEIRVQNRWTAGTGHGWAGVQNMFWNCYSYKEDFKVESPLGGMNWGIGCIGQNKQGDGFWESYGTPVVPRSLYLQQLKDRLGEQAVMNVTTESQRNGSIWDELKNWEGTIITNTQKVMQAMPEILVFPNPAEKKINVNLSSFKNNKVSIQLIDLPGRNILTKEFLGGHIVQIEIPESQSYKMISLKLTGNNMVITRKILIH